MKRQLAVAGLFLSLVFSAHGIAAEKGTAEEAQKMVQKTIEHMKANGREKTIDAVNARGEFVDRDLYVVIYDMKGRAVAHAGNAKMVGKELIDNKDVDGKYFVRERIEIAKTKGKGWQDYKFVNPAKNNVIEPKSMYIEKYEDLIIGCGIYKG